MSVGIFFYQTVLSRLRVVVVWSEQEKWGCLFLFTILGVLGGGVNYARRGKECGAVQIFCATAQLRPAAAGLCITYTLTAKNCKNVLVTI